MIESEYEKNLSIDDWSCFIGNDPNIDPELKLEANSTLIDIISNIIYLVNHIEYIIY